VSELQEWLRASLSLDQAVAEQAVREAERRAKELRLSHAAMLAHLQRDQAELQRLFALVVPPETWLFRHQPAFEAIREWLAPRSGTRVRMVSLGCARGAEPLSMAATAASMGRTAHDTEIIGIDWHHGHLREAALGSCSPLAQRSALPAWAVPWFEPDTRGWIRLHAQALAMIRWQQADLVHDALPSDVGVAMCRNVAIYLSQSAREILARKFTAMIQPDGLLCLGHADPGTLWNGTFESAECVGGFVFRPCEPREPSPAIESLLSPPKNIQRDRLAWPSSTQKKNLSAPALALPNMPAKPAAISPTPSGLSANAAHTKENTETLNLLQIQVLADTGALLEAATHLEALLSREGMNAQAWALLGFVRLGQARLEEAEGCFRKVVYLQPNHPLSLLQLSALAERRGDQSAADRLRIRAARAAAGEDA